MGFATLNQIPLSELMAMANGAIEDTITDMDFLETLAAEQCFLLPPWVMRANPAGGLTRVCRLVYTIDSKLDKSRVLVDLARRLHPKAEQRLTLDFGPRFSL